MGRGAENQRRLGAPAVRITVIDGAVRQKRAFVFQQGDDLLINLVHMVTGKQLYVVAVQTVVVDVVECPDAVLLSHHEVIDTVIRSEEHTSELQSRGHL